MDKFTSKHYAFLILATGIVSIKTYPGIFIKDGGRESWIGVIIASILALGFYTYIIGICKKYNCYNFHKIYQKALGEKLSKVFIGLYIITLFMTLVESASAEANSMHTNMLLNTPVWYLLLFFIVPIIYTIRKDIVAVMTITMIGIVLIMLAGINLSILTARYKSFERLFPIFSHGLHRGFFLSIMKILGLYGGISITLPYLVKIKDNTKIIKHTVVGYLIVAQMQIVAVSGVIMAFGIDYANIMPYPKLIQTQQVSYMRFLEFGELYVMLQIVGGWILKYVISFYAILLLSKEFNLKKKHLVYMTYIISVLVYIAAYFIANNLFVLFSFFNIYAYVCLVNFIIIPFIVFTVFAAKMNKEKLKINV